MKKFEIINAIAERSFNSTETYQLLRSNTVWFWSWGSTSFKSYDDKALFFTVSGYHHKGIVLITLGWDDTYTVSLLSRQWLVKKTIKGIYFDQLNDIIDIEVERRSQYVR